MHSQYHTEKDEVTDSLSYYEESLREALESIPGNSDEDDEEEVDGDG